MTRLRLVKIIDEYQFLTCLKHSLWGSRTARFKNWQEGDYLAFIVDKALSGLAEVVGKPFQSKQKVWDNDLFPHRIPIKFTHVLDGDQRIPILGEVRDALTSEWGPKYGWGILNQQLLVDEPAEIIVRAMRSQSNSLSEIISNLDQYLEEAKQQRKAVTKITRKQGRPRKETFGIEEIFETKEEESQHSKAQYALIKLGRITGCSVWIASNDRNRIFRGKPLGEDCLKSLPNLGLNEEATRRVSLIDILWIRQNAPVCAFEVETTSVVYSGLLRMSDLLSVVPALRMKLFIVAQKERQERVISELSRPTFQKIGLNEYCKFIPIEKLEELSSKVRDFGGHIQSSILDTIAIEVEEEFEESL
ncbi:MAG: hypothetical protein IBX41_06985 [Methanophagales archaeon]|nr:hypothetical protein [Methanophagales archaeon]